MEAAAVAAASVEKHRDTSAMGRAAADRRSRNELAAAGATTDLALVTRAAAILAFAASATRRCIFRCIAVKRAIDVDM